MSSNIVPPLRAYTRMAISILCTIKHKWQPPLSSRLPPPLFHFWNIDPPSHHIPWKWASHPYDLSQSHQKKLKKMKHQGKYVINSAHQPCLHTRAYRPCKPLHPIHVNVDLGSIVQGSDLVNKHNHIASYSYPLLSGFVAHRAWTQWNLNQMYQTNMWRD